MKKIVLIIIIVLELSLIKIPKYEELNNLAIIEEVIVEKRQNKYIITLKEIIPQKKDQGINYDYKYYQESSVTIKNALEKIQKKTKKKLYLNKVKSLTTNITITNNIINDLNIKPSIIIHKNNINLKTY